MKILLLDIERSPYSAYIWSLWDQGVPLNRVKDSSMVLCWTAKWYGSDEIMFDSSYKSGHKKMIKAIHKLLQEADAVITYNGKKFDMKVLNMEFLMAGLPPPPPKKNIDLYQTAKTNFLFLSNKLTYICERLDLGSKIATDFNLWVDCMNNKASAWKAMEEYNIHDVVLLEKLYDKLRPWVKGHSNYSVHTGDLVCPVCGSHNHHKRGYHLTSAGKYQRHQCKDCGHWFRSHKSEAATEKFISL